MLGKQFLSRDITNKINWVLDNLMHPVLRDSRFFMTIFFRLLFKDKYKYFFEFKEKAFHFTEKEYQQYYYLLADCHLQRKTDLNKESINKILDSLVGERVLDIACGSGYLARLIHEKKRYLVTGIDISIPDVEDSPKGIDFIKGNMEHIDFPDNFFDTVICAHTLEHVQHLETAVKELRRVSKKRLIIIVPCQREYRFTFDLHLHFFPYSYCLRRVMKNEKAYITKLGNDFFYMEDY
jgi:ubiquinone/menaquinone biosynthesis C-methylase UbiE